MIAWRGLCTSTSSKSSRLAAVGGVIVVFSFLRLQSTVSSSAMAAQETLPQEPVARCRPVVLCGPSGAGKSTLIELLRKEFPDSFGFSVSHTTRDPRAGERDTIEYNFVTKDAMEAEIAAGKFLEHAHVHGNIYGTSFEAVDRVASLNRICILDIDIQGVMSCKRLKFDVAAYIFIAPPDLETLEARLRGRGTETEERVQKRLRGAVGELDAAKTIEWDGYIVNDSLETAYAKLRELTAPARAECAAAQAAAAAAGEGAKNASGAATTELQ